MSSDEDRGSLPAAHHDSDQDSSASSELQVEYEELLRYAIVTPNTESSAAQPAHSKGELLPEVRLPAVIDVHHSQAGSSPVVRETRMEAGKGHDSDVSKTDGSSPVLTPRKPSHPVMDFFSSNLLGDSSSLGSTSSHRDAHGIIVSDFLVSDENLQKMENVLDLWSSGLKTNIISELSKWRLNFIDWHRMEMKKEKEKHAADIKQLCNQIHSLKELQKAYEISIGRKDEVISSLSHAIRKQKERIELMRTFFHWRISHVKSRQDAFEGQRADQHFQGALLKKAWRGWRALVERRWRDVVERACQARAEEVCVQLSGDYEGRLALLSGALENAKAEIQRLQQEKEQFEESMKKAFMRGVCALNLEAMTMFQSRGDTGGDFLSAKKDDHGPGGPGKEHAARLDTAAAALSSGARPLTPPAATMGVASSAAAFPSAASLTSTGAASSSSLHVSFLPGAGSAATAMPDDTLAPRTVTAAQQRAGRTITARVTGRCDFAARARVGSGLAIMGVSPPMSSVVVEKHHPVTVQTIPQATAAKHPRTIRPDTGTSASRSLGTRSTHTASLGSLQSIKVVD